MQGAETSVDAVVAFVGKTARASWIERMHNADVLVSGGVALAWFDYDVYQGSTYSHCGVNAVTMPRTAREWRIVTMLFTTAQQHSCSSGRSPR